MPSLTDLSLVRGLRAFRSYFGIGLALVAASTVRCSLDGALDDPMSPGDGDGDSSGVRPTDILILTTAMGGGSGTTKPNPLCGDFDDGEARCMPDHKSACSGFGGAGGATAEGGQGGGVTFNPGDLDTDAYGCQVVTEDCDEEICPLDTVCVPSGASAEGDPCVSASDCVAGMACVGEGLSGVCRPYCCLGTQRSCQPGNFCDVRTVPGSGGFLPVCVPVDGCQVSDPFPCPEGEDCACQGDRACIVVRADGATSCAHPGSLQTGDECNPTRTGDCAHGFVCSPSAGCMKLCDRGLASQGPEFEEIECPGGGKCAPPPEFPDGLGVCVGADQGDTTAAR